MSWNFRIFKKKLDPRDGDDEAIYQLHECYYDDEELKKDNPIPHSMTVYPVSPSSQSIEDLRWSLGQMLAATFKPVLVEGKDGIEEFHEDVCGGIGCHND